MALKFDRKTIFPILFGALATWMPGSQAATMMSAHELFVSCKAEWADKAYLERYAGCRGYLSGVADVLKHANPGSQNKICIPQNATKGQVSGAVVDLLRSEHYERPGPNPDKAAAQVHREDSFAELAQRFRDKNTPALRLVLEVLQRKFPCK